ncbi:MAG: flagellar motor protein MotB [Actinomycetota bacterium]
MARKKKEHAHPDERWLLTYADMITLLFVLFIVLFAISSVNVSKFELLKRTLQTAFADGVLDAGDSLLPQQSGDRPAPVTEGSPQVSIDIAPRRPVDAPPSPEKASAQQALETHQLIDVREKVKKAAAAAGLKDKIKATVDERGLAIRLLTDGVLFDLGSAHLRPEGRRLLEPIGKALLQMPNDVRIEGHTDSTPIHTAQFPNNRWLGGARALAVEDDLIRLGVPEKRVESTSYGASNPIYPNDSPGHRSANRRVEILVLRAQGPIAG